MTAARVGPFALVERIAARDGQELWRADRVSGSRSPRIAAVRRAAPGEPGDAAAARAAADRIQAEYDVLRRVDDPRIPAALGHWAGEQALATAWVSGVSLASAAQAHQRGDIALDAATVVDVVIELAEALRTVHRTRGPDGGPLAHGHLSLRRVVLDADGGVHLMGLGRSPAQGHPDRRTPDLVPPELLAGAPAGPAADHWALGALLVHLLGGSPLYGPAGDHGPADLAARKEGRVAPWTSPLARVNPALGRILDRLLSLDPAARYPDGGQLVLALSELRRGLRGPADRRGLVERLAELGMVVAPPVPRPAPAPAPAPSPAAAPATPASTPPALPDPLPDPAFDPTDAPSLSGLAASSPAAAPPSAPPAGPSVAEAPTTPGTADPAEEKTTPLVPLDAPPADSTGGRPPVHMPASSRRLGLGEIAAVVALVCMVVAAVVAFALRS